MNFRLSLMHPRHSRLFAVWALCALGGLLNPALHLAAQQPEGPLRIEEALFEDYNGWKGPRLQLKAGAEGVIHFRIGGFERREGRDEAGFPEYRVELEYEVEMRDPEGVLVAPVHKDRIQQVLGPRDDQWRPAVRWSAVIPAWAPSGSYPITIRAADRVGDQRAESTLVLQVRGEAIPSGSFLQATGLAFARSLEGPWTATRYFALNDRVYVRFHVIGFKVSEDRRVWVEQDLTVLDREGRTVIHQQNAIEETSQEFYPPRYLTTNFQVELEDPQPGAYELQVTLRDRIGGQNYSQQASFSLRP